MGGGFGIQKLCDCMISDVMHLYCSPKKKKKLPKPPVVTGFDKGYTAQSILGATDTSGGELHFLISWYAILKNIHTLNDPTEMKRCRKY